MHSTPRESKWSVIFFFVIQVTPFFWFVALIILRPGREINRRL